MKTQTTTVIQNFSEPPEDYEKLFNNIPKRDLEIANENVNTLDVGTLIMAPYGNRYYGAVVTGLTESAVFFRSTLGQWNGKARHREVFNVRLLPLNCEAEVVHKYSNVNCSGEEVIVTTSLYERDFASNEASGLLNVLWLKTGEKCVVHWGYLSIGQALAQGILSQRRINILREKGNEYDQGDYYIPMPRQAAHKARRRIMRNCVK
uniref:Tudor domain-containing protein n=1 Tax=Panagrellus redivivus TaxID=6233 RepID=A0A7E4ZU78_PANRE